jgi:photosystem II stability/assembly factor-like uncharacterized protein
MTQVRLLIGTKKGAWIYTSDEHRKDWTVSDPCMPGWTILHMAADTRHDPVRIYAGASHWAWGPLVIHSDDGGQTWNQKSTGLKFPEDMGLAVQSIWNVKPGPADEPGVVYAGTQPAGLFRSEDWGETWAPVEGLNRHEYRAVWSMSGGGDSCTHSIEIDPRDSNRMLLSISSGGTYETQDRGETWRIRSHRMMPTTPAAKKFMADIAELFPDQELPPNVDPAAMDEMHKLIVDPKEPDRLWGQAHIGVFRSDKDATDWQDVTEGLPSFHGFPITITRHAPDAVFVVPLAFEADNFRVCNGQFAVYRTRDQGASWDKLTNGLPGPNDYQSVYREGLATDGLPQEGVYVGTSNGQVFASADTGDSWQRLPGTLPPIVSVTAAAW